MGTAAFDCFSICHFLFGSLFFVLLKSIQISLYLNFLLANGAHLFIEFIENDISPSKKKLESNINHISDILFFLLGWVFAYILNFEKFYNRFPIIIKSVFWFILFFIIFKEIIIEIFPYINFFFIKGVFIK